MNKRILISMIFLASNSLLAQFTYLNEIGGDLSDSIGDTFNAVEIINDTIYTYGAYVDNQGQFLQLKKYDLNGDFLTSKEFLLTDSVNYFIEYGYVFAQTIETNHFYISLNFNDGISHKGWVGKVSLDLDTLWTKTYDQYFPYTSYRKNLDVGDGIVLVGEFDSDGSQVGTMLTKIDYDGNIIWDEVLRPANGNINRNANVVKKDDYLLLGGGLDPMGF